MVRTRSEIEGIAAVCDTVRARRSIRAFLPLDVDEQLVWDLLENALWAPSPHNTQPWRFCIIQEPRKHALAHEMAVRLETELRADGLAGDVIERQTSRSRQRIVSAPVLILCSLVTDGLVLYPDPVRSTLEWQMAVQSVGAVLQTLFLLGHESGLGSCWMAAPMYCPDVVRHALDLPEEHQPQALVLMGYPASAARFRERRNVDEMVIWR